MSWKTSLNVGLIAVILLCVGALAWRSGLLARADSDALWKVVHGLCVRDERINHNPAPCTAVDLQAGYAVLRDQRGKTQVLIIPTAKVTGIEDPATRAPGAPNYWQDAWLSRSWVEKLAGRPIPREDVILAVNSIPGRSQNQLHIHVDCIKSEIKATIAADIRSVGPAWAPFPDELYGKYYRAMWVPGADLSAVNPFALLFNGDPAAAADMGNETLVAIPVNSPAGVPGFVLLSDHAHDRDDGHGENLQDHGCGVLRGD